MDLDIFPRKMFYDNISLKKAKEKQDDMKKDIEKIEKYSPRKQSRKDFKNVILDNMLKLFEEINEVIGAFERNTFKHFDCDIDSYSDFDYGPTKSKQNFEESIGE